MRPRFATAALAALPLVVWACASGARPTPATGPTDARPCLLVASDLDNPPFAYVGPDDRPAGRDVEMMELVATELEAELVWRRLPFSELLSAAEDGQVDLVCATLGVTPERAERVAFSRPYFETTLSVLVRHGPGEPVWLSDLTGRRVGAARGTTAERAARERLPDAFLVLEDEGDPGPGELLARGLVDAVVVDRPAADRLERMSAGALRRLLEELAPERYALVLPRERADLRGRVDAALERLEDELREVDLRYGLLPSRAPRSR